jgi:hypothetical protein
MPNTGIPKHKKPFHHIPDGPNFSITSQKPQKTAAATTIRSIFPKRRPPPTPSSAQTPPTTTEATKSDLKNHVGTNAGHCHTLNPRHLIMLSVLPSTILSAPQYFHPSQLAAKRIGNQMRFQRKYGTINVRTLRAHSRFQTSAAFPSHPKNLNPIQKPLAKKNQGTPNCKMPPLGNDGT